MEFTARRYQVEGIEHLIQYKRALIPLPGGTGKSCIPLIASRELGVRTIVILCSGNALFTWVKNIHMHRPDLADDMVVIDKTDKRKHVWNRSDPFRYHKSSGNSAYNDPKFKVVIAKALSFQYDWPHIKYAPDMLILDEPQKWSRKTKSNTYKCIREFSESCRHVAALTGNPINKGRQNFWPILHLLNRKKYPSYWRFVQNYVITNKGAFGVQYEGPKNTPAFREYTKDVIFRSQSEITGLPATLRDVIPVKMTPKQARLYESLAEDMIAFLESGELLIVANTLAKVTRLRQCLVCPMILDPEIGEYGAGIEATLDHMHEDTEERSHCVWATPFTQAIPYMKEALKKAGHNKIVTFMHGMTTEDLKLCEQYFRTNKDAIAICSIQFAQSYELETGNPVYFIGYDFDPTNNEQMEWRLRRLTNERGFVNAYYIRNLETYDDTQLQMLSDHTINTKVDYSDMRALKASIKGNRL